MEMLLLWEPPLLAVVMLVTIDSLCIVNVVPVVTFVNRLFRAHEGKFQASRAFLMPSVSCCNIY